MNKIADALTFFRLFSAPVLFVLILMGQWQVAMWLFIAAILSDAFDGVAARRWPPKFHRYREDPHAFDNLADGALSVSVVVALVVRFCLAWLQAWPDGHLALPWLIAAVCILAATACFLFLVGRLVPDSAEKVDICHGIFYALLLVACLTQITMLTDNPIEKFYLTLAYIAALAWAGIVKWDRMTSRPDATYRGTKTWGALFSRP